MAHQNTAVRSVLIAIAALPAMAIGWSMAEGDQQTLCLYWAAILVTAYFVHHGVHRSELRVRAQRRKGEIPKSAVGPFGYFILLCVFGALIVYAWRTREVLPMTLALAAVTACFAALFQNLPGNWSPEALEELDGVEGAAFARTGRHATGQPWVSELPTVAGWYDVLDEDDDQGLMQVELVDNALHARPPETANWFPLNTWGGFQWRGPITSSDFVPPPTVDEPSEDGAAEDSDEE